MSSAIDPYDLIAPKHYGTKGHLGFGTGEHFCLGAHLARAGIRALLEEMAKPPLTEPRAASGVEITHRSGP